MGKRDAMTDLSHFVAGFIAGVSSFISVVFAILLVFLFIIYELDEDWKIRDGAFIDIRQFAVAFVIGGVIMMVWRMIT